VVEILVDFRYPQYTYFAVNVYYLTTVTYTGELWQANMAGQPAKLRKDVGWQHSFDCRHRLGDAFNQDGVAGCKYPLEAQRRPLTVTSMPSPSRVFVATPLLPTLGLQWAFGEVLWVTGNNAGFKQDVEAYDSASGQVTLALETPFPIEATDTCTIIPGCDRKRSTCKTYEQILNYGGFPFMPGTDRMIGGPIG
jgi:hypothetical protein